MRGRVIRSASEQLAIADLFIINDTDEVLTDDVQPLLKSADSIQVASKGSVATSQQHGCQVTFVEPPDSLLPQTTQGLPVALQRGRRVNFIIPENPVQNMLAEVGLGLELAADAS